MLASGYDLLVSCCAIPTLEGLDFYRRGLRQGRRRREKAAEEQGGGDRCPKERVGKTRRTARRRRKWALRVCRHAR